MFSCPPFGRSWDIPLAAPGGGAILNRGIFHSYGGLEPILGPALPFPITSKSVKVQRLQEKQAGTLVFVNRPRSILFKMDIVIIVPIARA